MNNKTLPDTTSNISAKDLAKMLNVSPSAVSFALNGKEGISPETRRMILTAAEKYGLKRRRKISEAKTINLVIYKKHGLVYSNTAFFPAVIEGIGLSATNFGYDLRISYLLADGDLDSQLATLMESPCDGIILLATEMLDEDTAILNDITVPLVLLDSHFHSAPYNSVVIDNQQGAYAATKHLIDCGHKHIGHLASSVKINNFTERHSGFMQAIADYPGIKSETIYVSSTQDVAYMDMLNYLSTAPQLPTALFADNDIIAVSCIRALKDSGYNIPNDVSIVGFDDMPIAYATSPKLTTVKVAKEQLGHYAVVSLHNLIYSPSEPVSTIALRTSLMDRSSVCKLTRK